MKLEEPLRPRSWLACEARVSSTVLPQIRDKLWEREGEIPLRDPIMRHADIDSFFFYEIELRCMTKKLNDKL
jgi:hypothetical protein